MIEALLSGVLKREGWPKITDHPWDRGGLTKGGVTLVSYNRWLRQRSELEMTPEEFRDLPESSARAFLYDTFCRPFAFVQQDRDLFEFLCDWSVNAWADDPAKALQQILKDAGVYTGSVDGIPGPGTRQAWGRFKETHQDAVALRQALVAARIEFHIMRGFDAPVLEFLKSHPDTQLHNLRGWIWRSLAFLKPKEVPT